MESIFECPICMEFFSLERKPLIPPCGHTICEPCLQSHLVKQQTCPCCLQIFLVDPKSFTINYSLIPNRLPQRPKKDHSEHSNKLHNEIKFFEELSKTLTKIQDEYSEAIRKTENEIMICIKSLESFTEKLKIALNQINTQTKLYNIEKITKQQTEISNLIESRKEILKNIKAAHVKGQDIDPNTLVELDMLRTLKTITIPLRKTEFNHKVDTLTSTLQSTLLKTLEIHEQSFEFCTDPNVNKNSEENLEIATGKRNRDENIAVIKASPQSNEIKPTPTPINERNHYGKISEQPLNEQKRFPTEGIERNYAVGRGQNPNRGFNPQNRSFPDHKDQKKFEVAVERNLNSRVVPENEEYNLFNPQVKFEWFVEGVNGQERLPDYAWGQIERCRVQNLHRIRIMRGGRAECLANLDTMEYFRLDNQEKIIFGSAVKLICKPYN